MSSNILKLKNRQALDTNKLLPLVTVEHYAKLRQQLLLDIMDNGESFTAEEFTEYKYYFVKEVKQ